MAISLVEINSIKIVLLTEHLSPPKFMLKLSFWNLEMGPLGGS